MQTIAMSSTSSSSSSSSSWGNQWISSIAFVLVLIMNIQPARPYGLSNNNYASGCTGQELRLMCKVHHRVAIKRVFYGVKQGWGCRGIMDRYAGPGTVNTINTIQGLNGNTTEDCCRASHTDCLVNDDSKYPSLNTRCSGYQNCTIHVQKVQTRRACIYRSFTDYMTIIYDCVSVGDIANFCSNDRKRGKYLYLSNKEYPVAIKPSNQQADCKCMVRIANSKGISIHSVDVLLAWAERGPRECRRSLRIQDPMSYERHIQCAHRGFYGFRTIYSRPVGNVTVTLSSKPGDGMAFVWLQVKASEANGSVEVICGQTLQTLLDTIKEQRNRENMDRINREMEKKKKEEEAKKAGGLDKGQNRVDENAGSNRGGEEGKNRNGTTGSEWPKTTNKDTTNDLIPIIAGIVVAGFILIVIVIITIACYCRRIRKEKQQQSKPLELYPAVTSEPLDLSSYCKYDYDDEHLCTINRAPIKMASRLDEGVVANSRKPNGFISVATAEEYQIHKDPPPSPPLPAGISTPHPSVQSQPLLDGQSSSYREVHYPGDLSLRFVKPIMNNGNEHYNDEDANGLTIETHNQGHTTLPSNRKAVLIHSGPKSPLGKRSKSVTFSQPVAMVTPMNSESEESMEGKNANINQYHYKDDFPDPPNYDNLQSLDIPDKPLLPGKPEFIKIPRWEKDSKEDSPSRPLSTFQNSPSDEIRVMYSPSIDPSFSPDSKFQYGRDPRLTPDSDDTAYMSDRDSNSTSSSLWSPTRKTGKPVIMPKPQKAELFESGV